MENNDDLQQLLDDLMVIERASEKLLEEIKMENENETTLMEVVTELYNALITKNRHNGEEIIILDDDTKEDWMTDIIHDVHKAMDQGFLPDDTCYQCINRVLGDLMEGDEDSEGDDLREMLYEIEPDVYTSDLTAWLNARNDHVYYITRVKEEFGEGLDDGFQLLSAAQGLYIQDIGNALITAMVDHLETV